MNTEKFANAPFNLDIAAQAWVKSTHDALSLDDKLRQLFTLISFGANPAQLDLIRAFRPGGVTRFGGGTPVEEQALLGELNDICPTPLLVSADLEGSRTSFAHGQQWPNPLALAAIDDLDMTQAVYQAMAEEARAVGINWTFTPVLDINAEFRSAIVATRSYGSDIDVIERHAMTQLEVFQRNGIAAAVKHFPGEGFDDRDQHLVTTINPLSLEDWWLTFGRLYQSAIKRGVLSVMSAHIALPAYIRDQAPEAGLEACRPASISTLINQKLLRQTLGFEGLIVSDATAMAGLGSWSHRSQHLPEVIASGCDVILFADDPETDLDYLKAALDDGRLTEDRVNDAVARQLAMKAALGLHKPAMAPHPRENAALATKVARKAPTLVKDVPQTLPLDPVTHKRVLVFSTGVIVPLAPEPIPMILPDLLEQNGFEITMFTPGMEVAPKDFDLILYLFGEETLLSRGRIFLDWLGLTGNFVASMQRYWHDTPNVMISFGYPYMLYDAPRMPTAINAYATTDIMQQAVLDLLLGRAPWNTNNPVDPFCGLEDARY